ncbi:unnamed protein product [Sympodiomycopsis kandeliae]
MQGMEANSHAAPGNNSAWPSSPSLWAQLPSIPSTPEEHCNQQQQPLSQHGVEDESEAQETNVNPSAEERGSHQDQPEIVNDHDDDDDDDDDGQQADFSPFDIGNPWTQAVPATQFHRKQWLRGFKGSVESSSDALQEGDLPYVSPRAKRRRLSRHSDCDLTREQLVDEQINICNDTEEAGSPQSLTPNRVYERQATVNNGPDGGGSQGDGEDGGESQGPEDESRTDDSERERGHAPVTPCRPSSFQPILSLADQEALSTFLDAALSDDDDFEARGGSSDVEILDTPPAEFLRRPRGLARMISDLAPEKKEGYWAQFDDYQPPNNSRDGDATWLTQSVPPARRLGAPLQAQPETPIRTLGSNKRSVNTDSRLLPNRLPSPGSEDLSYPYTPNISRLDTTLNTPRGTTLIARSRNANGMGLATKTWKSTWRDDGNSRLVRGRVVTVRNAETRGRARGKGRGRGRGGNTGASAGAGAGAGAAAAAAAGAGGSK